MHDLKSSKHVLCKIFYEPRNVFNRYVLLFIVFLQLPWRFGPARKLVCTCMRDKALQTVLQTLLFCSFIFQKFQFFEGAWMDLSLIMYFSSLSIYLSKSGYGSTCRLQFCSTSLSELGLHMNLASAHVFLCGYASLPISLNCSLIPLNRSSAEVFPSRCRLVLWWFVSGSETGYVIIKKRQRTLNLWPKVVHLTLFLLFCLSKKYQDYIN